MAGAISLSDAPCLRRAYLGLYVGRLGMIGVGVGVGTVTCSVGGLGTGLICLIVSSLRAGLALGPRE